MIFMFVWVEAIYAHPISPPTVEYAKTQDGRDVFWVEDRRHQTIQLRLDFDSGVGGCDALVQSSWNRQYDKMAEELLIMGGYARFRMGKNNSFVELSLFPQYEREGLRWMRRWIQGAKVHDVDAENLLPRDIVQQMLYGNVEQEPAVHDCRGRYHNWKKSSAPRYLFWGPLRMASLLPQLDFFWAQPKAVPDVKHEPVVFRKTYIPHIIYDEERGVRVQFSLFIPFPDSLDRILFDAYRHILDGGFGGRLMMRIREEKGWAYNINTKIHYGTRNWLEIRSECLIKELPLVRDELYTVIRGMEQIQKREIKHVQHQKEIDMRARIFSGMPYLISFSHQKSPHIYDDKLYKESLEGMAKKINKNNGFVWVLHGLHDEIALVWPVDWKILKSKEE